MRKLHGVNIPVHNFFRDNSNLFDRLVLVSDESNSQAESRRFSKLRIYAEGFVAFILLLLTAPLLFLLGILIKCNSAGPVFYKQKRVGINGQIFNIFKLRSMTKNAEAQTGPVLSLEFDARVTNIGRWLRNSHLDEIPQLINIVKGEMSFFGPRPERPNFVSQYIETIESYHVRHLIRPGLTGLAQVCLPYDATAEQKLEFDIAYVDNRYSTKLHLWIIYLTFKKIICIRFNQDHPLNNSFNKHET